MSEPRCEHYGPHDARGVIANPVRCEDPAIFDVLDPDGVAGIRYCRAHGRALCREYEEKLGELWTLRPLELVA